MLGVACHLVPASEAQAGVFDSPHARATMAAFADAVIPPDDVLGGADAGFVEMIYDRDLLEALLGLDVPVAPALRVAVVDLDRRALRHHRARFRGLRIEDRTELVRAALAGRLGLVYEGLVALVKVCYFGAQVSPAGWQAIGFPGSSPGYVLPVGPPPTHSETEDGNPP